MEGSDLDTTYRIFQPRPGELVLRKDRTVLGSFGYDAGYVIARKLLLCLGWSEGDEHGLKVGTREPRPVQDMEATLRSLRSAGVAVPVNVHRRLGLWGPWAPLTRPIPVTADRALLPLLMDEPMSSRPRSAEARRTRAEAREAVKEQIERGLVTSVLFPDLEQQLKYEINHLYLHVVPYAQRTTFPLLNTYRFLPKFLDDLGSHGSSVSRAQMLAAIVDVVSRKVWETPSRQPRPMRKDGGAEHRPQIRRADGALAWRANVSSGTPAARRIMWWLRPDGGVDLARLAVHDDYEMPER